MQLRGLELEEDRRKSHYCELTGDGMKSGMDPQGLMS